MSIVTIVWSMVASACLTLAGVHLLVWCRNRGAWGSLLFSLVAVATAGLAGCELWMMRAQTPEQYGMAVRWLHVPAWLIVLALVGFARIHLRAGRLWLAWTICAGRTFSLLLNFLVGENLNYLEVTRLRQLSFFGESVSVADGVMNPWMLIGQGTLLLLLIFLLDVTVAVWRRGARGAALLVAGSLVFLVLSGVVQAVLIFWEMVYWPFTASLFFMPVIAVMGYALSQDVFRAAQLSVDLRESQERMTMAAEAAGFGVWVWNVERNRIWGTERWLAHFGFDGDAAPTFEEVLQRIHPDDRQKVESGVRCALEARGDYRVEYRVILPDGVQRWVSARGRVYPEANGKQARMMGASIDITDRKQSELEVQRNRSEMSHLSRVAMLGELSGSIAHELNQPLTAILSNAQAAQRFLAGENVELDEIREILKDIVADDQRAGEVIRRLRLLLKKGEVHQQSLDLNEVVQDVLKLIRNDLLNHSILLKTEFAPGPLLVVADRVQLQQVLLNLIVNATDAMANAVPVEKRLVVVTERFGKADMRVSVTDSGTGLDPHVLNNIFTPFFTTKSTGMGLGLKVCRAIIGAHGGGLNGMNNPGRGATFCFTLPAASGAPS